MDNQTFTVLLHNYCLVLIFSKNPLKYSITDEYNYVLNIDFFCTRNIYILWQNDLVKSHKSCLCENFEGGIAADDDEDEDSADELKSAAYKALKTNANRIL